MVEKYIGDAVMAIFGAPVATENDALRCVMTGLELQRLLGAPDNGTGDGSADGPGNGSPTGWASGSGSASPPGRPWST